MQVSGIPFRKNSEISHLTTLSFAEKVIKAAKGESGIIEPTYVYLPGIEGGSEIQKVSGCDFFSVPIELGVRAKSRNGNFANIIDSRKRGQIRQLT